MSLVKPVKKPRIEREGRLFMAKSFYLDAEGAEYLIIGIHPDVRFVCIQVCNRVSDNYVTIPGAVFGDFVTAIEHCMAGKEYQFRTGFDCFTNQSYAIRINSMDEDNLTIRNGAASVTLKRECCSRIIQHADLLHRDIKHYDKPNYHNIIFDFECRTEDLDEQQTVKYLKASIAKRHPNSLDYKVLMDIISNIDYLKTVDSYASFFTETEFTSSDSE